MSETELNQFAIIYGVELLFKKKKISTKCLMWNVEKDRIFKAWQSFRTKHLDLIGFSKIG